MSKNFRSRIDHKTVSRQTFGNTFDKAGRVFKKCTDDGIHFSGNTWSFV